MERKRLKRLFMGRKGLKGLSIRRNGLKVLFMGWKRLFMGRMEGTVYGKGGRYFLCE